MEYERLRSWSQTFICSANDLLPTQWCMDVAKLMKKLSFSVRSGSCSLLISATVLLTAWPALAKESAVEMITLQHRFAADLVPLLQPLLEKKGGTLVADNNRLMVTCPDDFKEEFDALVQKLDIPLRRLKISLTTHPSDHPVEAIATPNRSSQVNSTLERITSTKNLENSRMHFSMIEGQKTQIYVNDTKPNRDHIVIAGKKYLSVIFRHTQEAAQPLATLRSQILNDRALIEIQWQPGADKILLPMPADALEKKTMLSGPVGQWLPMVAAGPARQNEGADGVPTITYKTQPKSPLARQIWLKVEKQSPSPAEALKPPDWKESK